jgi:hypothetical protein
VISLKYNWLCERVLQCHTSQVGLTCTVIGNVENPNEIKMCLRYKNLSGICFNQKKVLFLKKKFTEKHKGGTHKYGLNLE